MSSLLLSLDTIYTFGDSLWVVTYSFDIRYIASGRLEKKARETAVPLVCLMIGLLHRSIHCGIMWVLAYRCDIPYIPYVYSDRVEERGASGVHDDRPPASLFQLLHHVTWCYYHYHLKLFTPLQTACSLEHRVLSTLSGTLNGRKKHCTT